MDAHEIMAEARRLRDERFAVRMKDIRERAAERFNQTTVDVPDAYRKTANQHTSNIIDDEGRQIATLVYAMPVPHLTPPVPEDQPLTSKAEQFLIAMHQELEDTHGPVWWQCTSAQTHDNLGWIYTAPKKVPYKGQPKASDPAFAEKNERYKKDAGISGVFDYEYAPTDTVLYEGPVYHPHCVYVWKEVPLSSLRKQYGVAKNASGAWTTADKDALPVEPGYPMDAGKTEQTATVVEYWDAQECKIVVDQRGMDGRGGGYLLTEWTHGFGRVPYFARPAFVTEQLDEDKKFAGPLDGIYNEMPSHKRLRTMGDSVAYQTAFAPLKLITREAGEQIVDDSGQPLAFLELEPGKARQLAPGQDVMPIGQSPEIANLYAELAASQQRIERYTLSPVSKGVSPGADTANAALSNLHRFQLSTLDPMAKEGGRQARAIYRFWLEQIRKMQETVYVLDAETDTYLSLNADEIVSVNAQAKSTPDQGQQQLLIEKHATELWQAGAITETEMHEKRGKENPEEYVLANAAERLRKMLEPVVMQQIIADLGMMDAVNAMMQANAQQGSARNAVPGLMQQAEQMNTGMGSGSPGQPRANGVRMPATAVNTQAAQADGY